MRTLRVSSLRDFYHQTAVVYTRHWVAGTTTPIREVLLSPACAARPFRVGRCFISWHSLEPGVSTRAGRGRSSPQFFRGAERLRKEMHDLQVLCSGLKKKCEDEVKRAEFDTKARQGAAAAAERLAWCQSKSEPRATVGGIYRPPRRQMPPLR